MLSHCHHLIKPLHHAIRTSPSRRWRQREASKPSCWSTRPFSASFPHPQEVSIAIFVWFLKLRLILPSSTIGVNIKGNEGFKWSVDVRQNHFQYLRLIQHHCTVVDHKFILVEKLPCASNSQLMCLLSNVNSQHCWINSVSWRSKLFTIQRHFLHSLKVDSYKFKANPSQLGNCNSCEAEVSFQVNGRGHWQTVSCLPSSHRIYIFVVGKSVFVQDVQYF